jgi:hypothetical protein
MEEWIIRGSTVEGERFYQEQHPGRSVLGGDWLTRGTIRGYIIPPGLPRGSREGYFKP